MLSNVTIPLDYETVISAFREVLLSDFTDEARAELFTALDLPADLDITTDDGIAAFMRACESVE